MSAIRGYSSDEDIVLIVAASITCCLSLAVILTTCIFKEMRKKYFMQIIMMISLCDFLGNLVIFYPMSSSHCTFHGMWYFFFFGASYNWTVLLSYSLYRLVTQGEVTIKMQHLHLVAWSLAAIRAFLPYSATSYVTNDYWCDIEPKPGYGIGWSVFWNVIVFPVWIGLCFLLILYWRYKMASLIHRYALLHIVICQE
jgi:hypothetical protein